MELAWDVLIKEKMNRQSDNAQALVTITTIYSSCCHIVNLGLISFHCSNSLLWQLSLMEVG